MIRGYYCQSVVFVFVCLLGCIFASGSVPGAEDPAYAVHVKVNEIGTTWVEIDGQLYGAKPDEQGPIGGGTGYTRILSTGDYVVRTRQELLDALSKAESGQIVFLPGDVVIDFSVWVHAEQLVLEIPGGVTLASDRGRNGSEGALLYSTEFKTQPLIRAKGDNVRITGLRVRGPDPQLRMEWHRYCFSGDNAKGNTYYYTFPTSDGIRSEHSSLEVDNCELYGWSHAAVYTASGKAHRVHNNYIHHNQRHGLGYGVCLNKAEVLIEYNLFDNNRHSVAGTGRPGGGYIARHNVVLERANSHLFDMHGGRDRKDGTNVAGTQIVISNNTFTSTHQRAVLIRGVPQEEALIQYNWFYIPEPGSRVLGSDGNTKAVDNVYGDPPSRKEEAYSF